MRDMSAMKARDLMADHGGPRGDGAKHQHPPRTSPTRPAEEDEVDILVPDAKGHLDVEDFRWALGDRLELDGTLLSLPQMLEAGRRSMLEGHKDDLIVEHEGDTIVFRDFFPLNVDVLTKRETPLATVFPIPLTASNPARANSADDVSIQGEEHAQEDTLTLETGTRELPSSSLSSHPLFRSFGADHFVFRQT